jgi:hypothetical protein
MKHIGCLCISQTLPRVKDIKQGRGMEDGKEDTAITQCYAANRQMVTDLSELKMR